MNDGKAPTKQEEMVTHKAVFLNVVEVYEKATKGMSGDLKTDFKEINKWQT